MQQTHNILTIFHILHLVGWKIYEEKMSQNKKFQFVSTSPFIPHGGRNLRSHKLPDKCDPEAIWVPYNHHQLGPGLSFSFFYLSFFLY